jgi:Ca-activated chloride channel family protein
MTGLQRFVPGLSGLHGLAALALYAVVADSPPAQTFRAKTDVVVIDAAVTDNRAEAVTTLTKDDFEIRDNGVVQAILDFTRETAPLDVTITIDVSGSMTRADRAIVERALSSIGGVLTPADRASVVTFGALIAERAPMRAGPIVADLSGAGTGGTALFDALLLALVTPPAVDRRQFGLFMTDGDDNYSFFDSATVVETARHANAPLSIVLVENRASLPVRGALQAIAVTTGGEVIESRRRDGLEQAFLTALENFRTSYVLRYTPAGVDPGGWHDVSVTVKAKGYAVRARRGYWGVR